MTLRNLYESYSKIVQALKELSDDDTNYQALQSQLNDLEQQINKITDLDP